ncbi:MAG: hypothetical protein R2862_05565 [Thermoanaerobaculia bacterium]
MDGTELRQLTANPAADVNGRWSADGRSVYFLSSRSGSMQIWRLPLGRRRVDASGFAGSRLEPRALGRRLASPVQSRGLPACAADLDCTKAKLDEKAASKASGLIYDELLFRHWDSWSDGRRNHWFAMPVAGGLATDLMPGLAGDAPSRPFGGSEEMASTPDGKGIVFAVRLAGRDRSVVHQLRSLLRAVRLLDAAATADDQLRLAMMPVFSPDGKRMAYLAMERAGFEADRLHIVVRDVSGGLDGPDRR